MLWGAYDLVTIDLSTLNLTHGEPGLWTIFVLALLTVVFGGTRGSFGPRWGWRTLALMIAGVAGLAVVVVMAEGRVAPVTWLIYGVDTVFLVVYGLLISLAILLGTPGCEIGVVSELVLRAQGRYTPKNHEPHPCIVGFHLVDAWESRQRWRQKR